MPGVGVTVPVSLGVAEVVDCGDCTGANPDRYYSYRMEQGRTGRMLALLALGGFIGD